MSAETVSVKEEEKVPENVDQEVVNEPIETQEGTESEAIEESKEQMIPLSALQKERSRRQEAEEKARLYDEQQSTSLAQQAEEDLYEAATKGDLGSTKLEIMRAVEEKMWIKQNSEKAQEVDEKLTQFLKQRPNLTSAIKSASNRYEEAWTLMNALSPKQKATLKPAVIKKDAPGSPGSIPKAAGINQSVDFMEMSDKEFNAWRSAKRKR